jgi:hypothetical protein
MRKIIHLILIVLLLVPCSALQASHQPEFSTAGFFELPNSGREVFSMNPAWRFYKGNCPGAETGNSCYKFTGEINKKPSAQPKVFLFVFKGFLHVLID